MTDPTDPLQVAELIDAGHDVLLDKGWCQGMFDSEDGTVCAEGALLRACERDYDRFYAALAAMRCTLAVPSVFMWNDTYGRTEDEVFDAFRQTSKRLREQAG